MSDWRVATGVASLLIVVAVGPLGAQEGSRAVDSLRREYLAAAAAWASATARVEALTDSVAASRHSLLIAGGRTVRFSTDELTPADTAAIGEGLRRAHARAVALLGPEGATLFGREVWVAQAPRLQLGVARQTVWIASSERENASGFRVSRPVDPDPIELGSLRLAGDGIEVLAPTLKRFSQGSISLADEPERWEEAARELALSWTSVGRRCVLGSLRACEAVMTPQALSDSAPAWLEPSDAKAAVRSIQTGFGGSVGPNSLVGASVDSVLTDVRRCLKTDDPPACDRVLRGVPQYVRFPDPFSGYIRGSLAMHALELGGTKSLERLGSAPDSAPTALLAHVAGVGVDSLLSSWQSRVASELDRSHVSPLPATFSTLAWCSLLYLVAFRRRP